MVLTTSPRDTSSQTRQSEKSSEWCREVSRLFSEQGSFNWTGSAESLIHIVFIFRQYPSAVSADIEGMFLQVGVIPKDQPSLRFLWREDPSTEVAVFQNVRHIFGSTDSPTCANYALKRAATDNAEDFPTAAQSVQTNFYMDDYLESSPRADEAIQKSKELTKLLSIGGVKLTKFMSYDSNILQQIESNSDKPTMVNRY